MKNLYYRRDPLFR